MTILLAPSATWSLMALLFSVGITIGVAARRWQLRHPPRDMREGRVWPAPSVRPDPSLAERSPRRVHVVRRPFDFERDEVPRGPRVLP